MKKAMADFFRHRPKMEKKYQFLGTFRDYAASMEKSLSSSIGENALRQKVLEETKRILPDEISLLELGKQLENYPIISYADHHGLLNYSLLYNSNLMYAEIIKQLKALYVVVFATGNVPLNNVSHPRGFYFNGTKFNFFKKKYRHTPVYLLDIKLQADKKKGIESFVLNYSPNLLNAEEKDFLHFLFFEELGIEKAVKNFDNFSDQITFLNYKLWKYYFNKAIRDSVPEIIYLQSNNIIQDLLIDEMEKKDSLISMILFEPDVRRLFLKNFNGIACCWGDDMGSHLFWRVTDKKKHIRLQYDDSSNMLVGDDFTLELEKEAIINGLNTKAIMPTIFFDFLIITFLEGYLALGGFNQIEFLTQMQQAHVKSLKEIGMNEVADQFASRVTDGMICGIFPFDFDSGIDLIWHYNSTNGKFNGNMDGGLSQEDLDRMMNMKIRDMIESGVETMLGIVSGNR